jgi:hypothetical protein
MPNETQLTIEKIILSENLKGKMKKMEKFKTPPLRRKITYKT